jgi:hypothetical protein
MDTKKAASDYFEALYLKKHPGKFDPQRAALLKRLKKRKANTHGKQAKNSR